MKTNEFKKGEKFSFNESIQYAEAAVVSKHVLKNKSGNISLFAFGKGEGLSEHTAPFDAMVMIVDGTACVRIAEEDHMLTTGESIIMPANIPHGIEAVENFKMVLTMIKSKD